MARTTHVFQLHITTELRERLRKQSANERRTMTEIITYAVEQYLELQEQTDAY